MCCELRKVFVKALTFIIMEVFIIETELTNAMNLGKTSIKDQILLNIRELSFHRASMIVVNVGKSFMKAQILLYIIVFLLKRRLKKCSR